MDPVLHKISKQLDFTYNNAITGSNQDLIVKGLNS